MFAVKGKTSENTVLFSEEMFMILECVQNHGHEIPLDDHKIKPAFQSHRTSSQKIT